MDSMSLHNRVLAQPRAEETALAFVCHAADRIARERMVNVFWSINDEDGWLMRKLGKPVLNYLFYLAR